MKRRAECGACGVLLKRSRTWVWMLGARKGRNTLTRVAVCPECARNAVLVLLAPRRHVAKRARPDPRQSSWFDIDRVDAAIEEQRAIDAERGNGS